MQRGSGLCCWQQLMVKGRKINLGAYFSVTVRGHDDRGKKRKPHRNGEGLLQSVLSVADDLCRLITDWSSRRLFTCTRFMQDGLAQRRNSNGIKVFLWGNRKLSAAPRLVSKRALSSGSHAKIAKASFLCAGRPRYCTSEEKYTAGDFPKGGAGTRVMNSTCPGNAPVQPARGRRPWGGRA